MNVAIIHTSGQTKSKKSDGTWSCVMGKNRKNLIKKAKELRKQWQKQGYGPYIISLATINEVEIAESQKFMLDSIDDYDPLFDLRDPDEGDRT